MNSRTRLCAAWLLPALGVSVAMAADFAIPESCDDAVALVLSRLDDDSKDVLRNTVKQDLGALNRTWGRGIRQGFEMNTGNVALVRSCLEESPDSTLHPANASAVIMQRVWQAVTAE